MRARKQLFIKTGMLLFLAAYLGILYFSDYSKNVPMEKISAAMERQTFVSSLEKQGRTALRRFFQIDETKTDGFFYYKASSPMSVEEVMIVKAHDKKQADSFLEAARSHLSGQKQIFGSYGTDQMALLNEAVAARHGRYVYYLCGPDALEIQKSLMDLI